MFVFDIFARLLWFLLNCCQDNMLVTLIVPSAAASVKDHPPLVTATVMKLSAMPSLEEPHTHTHTHIRLMALSPGLPGWASTRKVKPIWILLKQETVSGVGISWAICKSAPCSRQITTPAPHHSVFYRPDALPAAQPTASKHWSLEEPVYTNH